MGIADQSRWRFVLTDMSGGTAAGGGLLVNCTNKTFSYHLNAGKTAQLTMNIDNPKTNYLLSNDCLLKVYRKSLTGTWKRMMVGDVIQVEEGGQGDTGIVTLVAADPWWRLQRRVVGMAIDSIGRGTGYSDGTAVSLVDNCQLIAHLLTNLNSVFNTGLSLGTVGTSTSSYIGPVYAQNAGDLFQQICNTLGGPSFEIVPLEPSGLMPATIIGSLNVVAALGQSRPNAIFEYGTGKHNVGTYDRLLTKDGLCNQAYSPPQGFPSVTAHGDTMIIGQNTTSQNAIGLYQDVVQADLATTSLRQELADEYVIVRKQYRQQITIVPTANNPMDYLTDYFVGDTVTARAFVNGGYRFNGTVRIYGVDFSIDDNDLESPLLTLIPS